LKKASSSESTPKSKKENVSYKKTLLDHSSAEKSVKKSKYVTKNPIYEDKESYNLEACI